MAATDLPSTEVVAHGIARSSSQILKRRADIDHAATVSAALTVQLDPIRRACEALSARLDSLEE